jgi:hypothetical protein
MLIVSINQKRRVKILKTNNGTTTRNKQSIKDLDNELTTQQTQTEA